MVISVDVGGTKSKAVLYNENGDVLNEVVVGSCHPMQNDDETIINNIQACILDDNAPIVFGFAGYGRSQSLKDKIDWLVAKACGNHPYHIIPDTEMAMYSTLLGHDGITVILGTGSVAFRKESAKTTQIGGWGFVLGDEGSGYELGQNVLKTFALEADGRKRKGIIFDSVTELYELNTPNELIAKVVDHGIVKRTLIAKAARIALDHPEECLEIIKTSASNAAKLITSAQTDDLPVVITGGLSHSQYYMDAIQSYLSHIHIEVAKHEPVYGGYIYHLKH